MPHAAEVHRLVFQLGDVDDLRETLDALDERIFDRRAEAAGQRKEALGRQVLVAEEDHQVVEQRLADRPDRGIRQVLGQVHAAKFGAKRTGDRLDLEGHFAHVNPPDACRGWPASDKRRSMALQSTPIPPWPRHRRCRDRF